MSAIVRINNFIACGWIYRTMSSIDKLVELLRKRTSQPKPEEKTVNTRNYLTQDEITSIRRKAAREFKLPWKGKLLIRKETASSKGQPNTSH